MPSRWATTRLCFRGRCVNLYKCHSSPTAHSRSSHFWAEVSGGQNQDKKRSTRVSSGALEDSRLTSCEAHLLRPHTRLHSRKLRCHASSKRADNRSLSVVPLTSAPTSRRLISLRFLKAVETALTILNILNVSKATFSIRLYVRVYKFLQPLSVGSAHQPGPSSPTETVG